MTKLLGAPSPALARFDLQGLAKKMSGLAPEFNQFLDKMIAKQLILVGFMRVI
jgi:hypothetical protein|uniref:Uncharacterized protein n=1 Tax=Populus trichocarpa TaxID=3694 RepID=B9N9E4_POPTR